MTDQSILEAALRDIAMGAQMMVETPLPNSALKRYAAEVKRVAEDAIKEAKS